MAAIRRRRGITHLGLEDELYEIPDHTVQVDETGLWRIVQTYECDYDSVIRLCPKPYSAHRTYPFAQLTGVAITRGEAMRARLECTYKGMTADFQAPGGDGSFGAGATYELIATTGEEPIETHPNYDGLTTSQLATIKAYVDNPEGNPPLSPVPAAQELIAKKLKGVDSYLCATQTFRVTYASASSPASVAGVGLIGDPPPQAPNLSAGQTWLLTGYNARRQGGAYEVSVEWRASGPAGWDTDLYN
jgi:hypothetical protein